AGASSCRTGCSAGVSCETDNSGTSICCPYSYGACLGQCFQKFNCLVCGADGPVSVTCPDCTGCAPSSDPDMPFATTARFGAGMCSGVCTAEQTCIACPHNSVGIQSWACIVLEPNICVFCVPDRDDPDVLTPGVGQCPP